MDNVIEYGTIGFYMNDDDFSESYECYTIKFIDGVLHYYLEDIECCHNVTGEYEITPESFTRWIAGKLPTDNSTIYL